MQIKGTLAELVKKTSTTGKPYAMIKVGDLRGSFWGKTDKMKVGEEYNFKYDVVEKEDSVYTNFKLITPTKEEVSDTKSDSPKMIRALAIQSACSIAPEIAHATNTLLDLNSIENIANVFLDFIDKEK